MSHALAAVLRRARRARATAARSLRLRYASAPRGLVQSWKARGRRGGFVAPAAVAPGLYYGPRYAAIWRSQATASSRRLAALATKPSATAPRRLWIPGGGCKLGGGKSEIRNPKSEIPRGGQARYTRAHENR